MDKTRRPNVTEKKELNAIIDSLSKKGLDGDEKEMIYKFRYYLRQYPKALTKFLRCVDWDSDIEVEEVQFFTSL